MGFSCEPFFVYLKSYFFLPLSYFLLFWSLG